jgi:hypothetical protein
LANEKQSFIAEKQLFHVRGALAHFYQPKGNSQYFSVNLHLKRTVKANLLLPLGMLLKVTTNWGRALLNFFKIKVAAKEAMLNWTSD